MLLTLKTQGLNQMKSPIQKRQVLPVKKNLSSTIKKVTYIVKMNPSAMIKKVLQIMTKSYQKKLMQLHLQLVSNANFHYLQLIPSSMKVLKNCHSQKSSVGIHLFLDFVKGMMLLQVQTLMSVIFNKMNNRKIRMKTTLL